MEIRESERVDIDDFVGDDIDIDDDAVLRVVPEGFERLHELVHRREPGVTVLLQAPPDDVLEPFR